MPAGEQQRQLPGTFADPGLLLLKLFQEEEVVAELELETV